MTAMDMLSNRKVYQASLSTSKILEN